MRKITLKSLLFVSLFSLCNLANATIILSGDVNIGNGIDGTSGASVNPDNALWFSNILGSGTAALVNGDASGTGSLQTSYRAINNYYNNLTGVTSSIFDQLITDSALAGIDLFISGTPDDAYQASEISAIQSFLNAGGTLLLIGETDVFDVQNQRINTLLEALNSDLRLDSQRLDGGFQATSNVDAHPFNAGVSSLTYAYTNTVSGGKSLFRTSNGQTFIATDASTVPLSAPSTLVLFCLALFRLGSARRVKA